MYRYFLVTVFALFVFVPVTKVSADAKSDYEYQYSQYQKQLANFKVLKKDYLSNPTLTNQQKSIIAAKQTLKSRDLAKGSYAAYLLDLIKLKNINYPLLERRTADLVTAREFFFQQAEKSQAITTVTELKNFSDEYVKSTEKNDYILRYGNLFNKIAQLIRFQIECKTALDEITPKLPVDKPNALKVRLEDLTLQLDQTNIKIEESISKINEEEEIMIGNNNYFPKKVEVLNGIRASQIKWIDMLIDVDLNYVQPKI